MSKFKDFLNEQLKNPKIKAEYDALEPEFFALQNIIDTCKSADYNKKEIPENIEDARDYALALERERNGDNEKTYSNEEVMKEFGITQKEIDEMEDVELEYELGKDCPLCKNIDNVRTL